MPPVALVPGASRVTNGGVQSLVLSLTRALRQGCANLGNLIADKEQLGIREPSLFRMA